MTLDARPRTAVGLSVVTAGGVLAQIRRPLGWEHPRPGHDAVVVLVAAAALSHAVLVPAHPQNAR